VKILEVAEADARHMGDPEGLLKTLLDHKKALEAFVAFLRDEANLPRTPALVDPASRILSGEPLGVGAATLLSGKAQEYVKFLDYWRKSYANIERYLLWAQHLEEKLKNRPTTSVRHRQMLQDACNKALEARNKLPDARDNSALAELGATDDLKAAYTSLSYLGARYELWELPKDQKTQQQRSEDANVLRQGILREDAAPEVGRSDIRELEQRLPSETVAAWVDQKEAGTRQGPKIEAEIGGLFSGAGILFSLVLASLVTLLALVVQVYPAGAFGTLKDYLATIVVGATSTVALNFLQGPLTGLFTRLRS